MGNRIKVQIVYRNYKSLHTIHQSLVDSPPEDVEYVIPEVIDSFFSRTGFKFYRKFGHNRQVSGVIRSLQKSFFSTEEVDIETDLIHFIQVVPNSIPKKPYVVEIEHAGGLFSFLAPNRSSKKEALNFLLSPSCKQIITLSKAARKTFSGYYEGDELKQILAKCELVYPASRNYREIYKKPSHEDERIKLLFVGNDIYRKGLHELLEAFSSLNSFGNLQLTVIANVPKAITDMYPPTDRLQYLEPTYSREGILQNFYFEADLFVFPTHLDTFGMAVIDALSCGTPVLATKQFALKEIIEEGKNGLFLQSDRLYFEEETVVGTDPNRSDKYYPEYPEEKLVMSIVRSISKLYENPTVIEGMSREAITDFQKGGRFSIGVRNEKLNHIYRNALTR